MGEGTGPGAAIGRFCWPEANARDVAVARAFYSGLFGWGLRSDADGGYAEWQQGGKSLGGLIGLGKQREQAGVPPHWMVYVAVADADGTAAKAREHGGTVVHGPFSIPGAGRFALLEDPTGARFSLYQEEPGSRPPLLGVPGTMVWTELVTPDPAKARPFYAAVFGWTPQAVPMGTPSGDYTLFLHDGAMAAGMMTMRGEWWGEVPPHWMVYFAVEDLEATLAKAASLGGEVRVPPTEVPGIGTFGVVTDPEGAFFSVLQMAGPAAG